jgi:hypothetical protein
MSEITPEKTHALLEKLANYVMAEVSTKTEVEQKILKVDEKIDKLVEYIITELPTRREIDVKLEEKADKDDVRQLFNGQDKIVQELEIIRTEQIAFHSGLRRVEDRVQNFEETH